LLVWIHFCLIQRVETFAAKALLTSPHIALGEIDRNNQLGALQSRLSQCLSDVIDVLELIWDRFER